LQQDATLRDLCNSTYIWDIFADFDIFVANGSNVIVNRLTSTPGYDAEATISPDGKLIVFTSIRSGDLELWTMRLDGSGLKMVTDVLGYDGGAFFSPDSKKLVFRASRPTGEDAVKYKSLLSYNLVSPTDMELFTVNVDGSDMRQISNLGGANWAPYYHPSGEKIIFASNYKNNPGFGFNLFMMNEDGSGVVEQITNDTMFDAFPMFSYDGRQLIFGSMRNSTPGLDEVNVFLADWMD
jgi:Tol biopolymer transport system component